MKRPHRKGFPKMLMTALLGLSLVATGACGADEPEVAERPAPVTGAAGTAGTAAPGAGVDAPIDVASVVDNPAVYAGRTVTVRGEVEEIFSPQRAFSLTDSGVIAENQVMVFMKGGTGPMLEENKQVRVTGRVRAYAVGDVAEYERDLGWEFTPELRTRLEKIKTVLIADTVTLAAQLP